MFSPTQQPSPLGQWSGRCWFPFRCHGKCRGCGGVSSGNRLGMSTCGNVWRGGKLQVSCESGKCHFEEFDTVHHEQLAYTRSFVQLKVRSCLRLLLSLPLPDLAHLSFDLHNSPPFNSYFKMGKQPAVVIIARHGARLDQANKQWHFASPTPYDPPLTYAGWTQARNLGTRIAGIIKDREKETGEEEQNGNPRKRKRQHRVIIHSSPFLRCIQTSIGISAGIGQSQTKTTERSLRTSLPVHPEQPESYQPAEELPDKAKRRFGSVPAKLRVDAYLGEWLSPGYFDGITPPPDSVLMVAGAKSDLIRAGDEIRGSDLSGTSNGQWANSWSAVDETGRGASRSRFFDLASQGMATVREDQPAYVPPSPMYAISSSDPIPGGYVAHARDACVEVDYQWDSMRSPQNWGDGGEYGEEWSSMRKLGLSRQLEWMLGLLFSQSTKAN